ncbi:MAG: hypothetical protein IJ354_05390 [Clostridia bacterium]|nr:hypothetical protein [Clostridia bacterium]
MSQYQPMYDSFVRTPDRYVPTARMSVSANVRLPGSDIDLYTGQLKPDHQRRHRTQAQRLEREERDREEQRETTAIKREDAKGGVRIEMWKGVLAVAVLLFVCGVALLWQQGQIVSYQKELNRQESVIAQYRRDNTALEEAIAAASDPAVICYAASQELHMIPAESAEAIHLVAVDTRPLETAKKQHYSATTQTLQSQTTPVPMTASN